MVVLGAGDVWLPREGPKQETVQGNGTEDALIATDRFLKGETPQANRPLHRKRCHYDRRLSVRLWRRWTVQKLQELDPRNLADSLIGFGDWQATIIHTSNDVNNHQLFSVACKLSVSAETMFPKYVCATNTRRICHMIIVSACYQRFQLLDFENGSNCETRLNYCDRNFGQRWQPFCWYRIKMQRTLSMTLI